MKLSNTHTTSIRVLVALTLTFICLAGFSGKAEAASCLTCHAPVGSTTDIRPVESTYRNITTGSIRGSHAKHIPAPTMDANTCTPCHGTAVSGYETKHRDGFITVTSAGGIGYSKKTSFPQSGAKDLVLGTCTTYCHSNGQGNGGTWPPTYSTPTWGTPATGTCGTCHAVVGDGNHQTTVALASGSHAKHMGRSYEGLGGAVACVICHYGGSVVAPSCGQCHGRGNELNPDFAANHADGKIDVGIVSRYGGTYSGTPAPGDGYGTCSSVYCHSSGQSADGASATPVYASVSWGAAPLVCSSCHLSTGLATGSHSKHLASNTDCGKCHRGATATSYEASTHINRQIDVGFATYSGTYSAGGAPGNGYGTCSTTSCHDNGKGLPATTPVWGATNVPACTACHALIPGDSHTKHVTSTLYKKAVCADCHTGYVQGTTAAANHVNGTVEVNTGGYPSPKSKGSAFASCATSYCHSSGQSATGTPGPVYAATPPAWGGTAGCGSCHKVSNIDTGSHVRHLDATRVGASCGSCHAGASDTAYNSENHVNNLIDLSGGLVSSTSSRTPGSGYTTCSTTCHRSPYGLGQIPTPKWGANTVSGCAGCHYDAGAITEFGPVTGSHTTVSGHKVACTNCHNAGTSATTAPSTDHFWAGESIINIVNVGYLSTNIAPHAVGSGYSSCSAASCHADPYSAGLVTSPVWGTTAGCAACHTGANVITTNGPATGSHTTVNGHKVACTSCHNTGTTATTAPSSAHATGFIDVVGVGYPANKTKGSAATTCSAASCHADPYSAGFVTTPVWGTTAGCAACHTGANVITATGPATGSHSKHGSAACISCHKAGTTATSAPSTAHATGFIDVVGVGYPANKIKGSAATTCSAASCHDNGKGVVVATPVWGATGVPACTACHALIPGESHTKHVSTTTYKKAVCADCHTGYVQGTTAAANHINTTVEVNVGSYPSPKAKGSAVGTCSTSYCHSSGQSADGLSATPIFASVTWGGTVVCGSCHATTTLATGTHAKHLAVDNNCDYCHSGAYAYGYASANHVNGQIEVTSMGYTAGGAPGNGYGTCSTAICHGSIAPPAWGVSTNNDSCTKCHGTGTVSVTAANKYVVAPTDATATDKGQVSSLPKVGAHQTHLQLFNGLSQQGANAEARCVTCHGPLPTDSSHVTGMSFFGGGGTPDPTTTFNGLATTSNGGTMTPSYSAGSCSNTYCHNPAGTNGTLNPGNAGTGTSPSWTNAAYLADTLKTDANCNACHKSPGNPLFTSTTDHSASSMPLGIATVCTDCHGHDGGTGGVAGQQHMDGIKYGGGNCDSCHSYDTVNATYAAGKWTGGTWGKSSRDGLTPTEGYGAHAVHINYIKGYLGIATTMTAANQVFGAVGTNPANVCGTCHSNLVANHSMGGSTVRTINFGDGEFKMGGAAGASLLFGTSFPAQNPKYNGVSGTSSATTAKTCSNLSCHYFTTPAWSTY